MSNENAELIRRAYRAYANGELATTMLQFVDPDPGVDLPGSGLAARAGAAALATKDR